MYTGNRDDLQWSGNRRSRPRAGRPVNPARTAAASSRGRVCASCQGGQGGGFVVTAPPRACPSGEQFDDRDSLPRRGAFSAIPTHALPRICVRGRPGPLKYPEGLARCTISLYRGGAVPASPLGAGSSSVDDARTRPWRRGSSGRAAEGQDLKMKIIIYEKFDKIR